MPRNAEIVLRRRAGETLRAIADDYGLTRQAVHVICAAWDPRIVTRVEAAEALGYSVSSLATLMSRHPDRWPAPIAHRPNAAGRGRVYLWDLDQLREAAGAPGARSTRLGAGATVSDEDGLIRCLECGAGSRAFRQLGPHLWRAHGLLGAEYRERHGLPATAALAADVTRARVREVGLARHQAGELDYLEAWQDPDRLRAMGRPGVDVSAASRDEEHVRANRRPGQEYAVEQMVAARLAKLDAAVRERGYRDLDHAVEQTMHLTAAAAGRALGVSAQTVRRRRGA